MTITIFFLIGNFFFAENVSGASFILYSFPCIMNNHKFIKMEQIRGKEPYCIIRYYKASVIKKINSVAIDIAFKNLLLTSLSIPN